MHILMQFSAQFSLQSALVAGVAAQLYTFFNDPKNYPNADTAQKQTIVNCDPKKGNCPLYAIIAYTCYGAVAVNIAAATNAFVAMNLLRYSETRKSVWLKFLFIGAHGLCTLEVLLVLGKFADCSVLQGSSHFTLAFS